MCLDRYWRNALLLTLMTMAAGCTANRTPARLIDGVNYMTLQEKVRDAHARRIESYPCLRVDAELEAKLDEAMRTNDVDASRQAGIAFLDGARALAKETSVNELDRMSDEGWRDLTRSYFKVGGPVDDAARQRIRAAFEEQTEHQYWFLRREVEQATSAAVVHRTLEPLRKGLEPPVSRQGRAGRAWPLALFALPSALTVAAIHSKEYHGDMDATFARVTRYQPATPVASDERDWDLLARYAPVIVQEQVEAPSYDARVDGFGQVMAPTADRIEIDVKAPTVYAYSRRVPIRGREHVQLVYTHWYPEHPKLKRFDSEAGKIEGVTTRITLDSAGRPAVVETVYNCGCFHRVYATESLEAAAQRETGGPERGKRFAIERRIPGRIDLIVPKTIADAVSAEDRPIVRCRSGWHGIVDVSFDASRHAEEKKQEATYVLRPYRDLERMKADDGTIVSMFYDNGLVRGAQRMEGVFFAPLGMLSAGQPRQRGTQLIHWDQYDFDDPALLERTLHLPASF